jgi:hypothetical protein
MHSLQRFTRSFVIPIDNQLRKTLQVNTSERRLQKLVISQNQIKLYNQVKGFAGLKIY